jgi:hypothetical protein
MKASPMPVEHDALPGLTGAVILLESDIVKLSAFRNHIGANATERDVPEKALWRIVRGLFIYYAYGALCMRALDRWPAAKPRSLAVAALFSGELGGKRYQVLNWDFRSHAIDRHPDP